MGSGSLTLISQEKKGGDSPRSGSQRSINKGGKGSTDSLTREKPGARFLRAISKKTSKSDGDVSLMKPSSDTKLDQDGSTRSSPDPGGGAQNGVLPERALSPLGLPERVVSPVELPKRSSSATGLPQRSSSTPGLPELPELPENRPFSPSRFLQRSMSPTGFIEEMALPGVTDAYLAVLMGKNVVLLRVYFP